MHYKKALLELKKNKIKIYLEKAKENLDKI